MKQPDFTIVTLSFNQSAYLPRAIESILGQRETSVEYVVVDPGSTDGSRAIIEGYRADLARVIFEPDTGPADGLRKGFSDARGRYLGFLNADDALLPGALREAADVLGGDPGVDVVLGNGYIVDATGRAVGIAMSTKFSPRRYVLGIAEFLQQATFFTADSYRRAGGINSNNRACWDGELLLSISRSGATFRRVPQNWALFTVHDEGITGSQRIAHVYQREQERLFLLIAGRPPQRFDRLCMKVARLVKWFQYPGNTWRKIMFQARIQLMHEHLVPVAGSRVSM